MEFSALSNEELGRNTRAATGSRPVAQEELAELVEELQEHRITLEVQNRALRDVQRELEVALQRYADLHDHLPIGYVTLDRKGRITQANVTAARWLRRDRAELAGTYMSWFLDAFDAGRFAAHLEACIDSATDQALELTLRLENGLQMIVQLSSHLAPANADGDRLIHTALTNIPKLKEVQGVLDDIRREQEGKASGRELQEPLLTIRKSTQALLQEAGPPLSDDIKLTLARIEAAAGRMDATLQQMLEYCCFGRDELALDPVNLEEVMQHVIVEHRGVIQRRNAEISVDRPLPCVRGSRLIIAQALAMILTHCFRHTPQDQAPRIRISAERRDAEIILNVLDQGSKLSLPRDENSYRVFEVLLRESPVGASVGLVLARRAIERLNGSLWFSPEPGKRNCIHLSFPSV